MAINGFLGSGGFRCTEYRQNPGSRRPFRGHLFLSRFCSQKPRPLCLCAFFAPNIKGGFANGCRVSPFHRWSPFFCCCCVCVFLCGALACQRPANKTQKQQKHNSKKRGPAMDRRSLTPLSQTPLFSAPEIRRASACRAALAVLGCRRLCWWEGLGWTMDFLGLYVVYGDRQFLYKSCINPI